MFRTRFYVYVVVALSFAGCTNLVLPEAEKSDSDKGIINAQSSAAAMRKETSALTRLSTSLSATGARLTQSCKDAIVRIDALKTELAARSGPIAPVLAERDALQAKLDLDKIPLIERYNSMVPLLGERVALLTIKLMFRSPTVKTVGQAIKKSGYFTLTPRPELCVYPSSAGVFGQLAVFQRNPQSHCFEVNSLAAEKQATLRELAKDPATMEMTEADLDLRIQQVKERLDSILAGDPTSGAPSYLELYNTVQDDYRGLLALNAEIDAIAKSGSVINLSVPEIPEICLILK